MGNDNLKTENNNANVLLAAVLASADLFENVECDINGEIKLMNEYRILVEPNSKENELLSRLLYGG
jgi:hypothetical protein